MSPPYDPRSIITPYAFTIHPDLLGHPLATPWQRLGAMAVDLAVVAFLSQVVPSPLLALALGLLLVWLASGKRRREGVGKVLRLFLGCMGVVVLVLGGVALFALRHADDLERIAEEVARRSEGLPMVAGGSGAEGTDPRAVLRLTGAAAALLAAGDAQEAERVAARLAREAAGLGLSREQIRSLLTEIIPPQAPWASESDSVVARAVASLAEMEPSPGRQGGSGAVPRGPSSGEAGGESKIHTAAADSALLDSLHALAAALGRERRARAEAEAEAQRAREELRSLEEQGLLRWVRSLLEDLGIGFGWFALYSTLTHVWWKGASPGKKLFRIRVVTLDNRPPGWWSAFERAGGYAAGFATGLLGFAQVFWDRNRQAIHDRVAGTFVIREGAKTPWDISERKDTRDGEKSFHPSDLGGPASSSPSPP